MTTVAVVYEAKAVISFDLKNGLDLEVFQANALTNFTIPPFVDFGLTGEFIESGHTIDVAIKIAADPRVDVTFGMDFRIFGNSTGPEPRFCWGLGTATFVIPRREDFSSLTCPPAPAP